MVKTSIPPGFRFHPTDIELVKFYLTRKVMQQKLPREAIAELDVYKYAPWDLPEKSSWRSRDLKWYFFCPREKKYSTGARMNRSTEFGQWKITGRDREIRCNNEISGMIRTLIFHQRHASKMDRTDWVMHEYRLKNKDVTDRGFSQDAYVICMIFQKNGRGPRKGAQYGAPFEEYEWDEEDDEDEDISVEPTLSTGLLTGHPVNICNDPNSSNAHGMTSISANHCRPSNESYMSGIMPSVSSVTTLVHADDISPTKHIPNVLNDDNDIPMLIKVENDNTWTPNETTEREVGNHTYGIESDFFDGVEDWINSNPTSLTNNNGDDYYPPAIASSSSDLHLPSDSYLELSDLLIPLNNFEQPCSLASSSASGSVPALENLQSYDPQITNYLIDPGTSGQKFHGLS